MGRRRIPRIWCWWLALCLSLVVPIAAGALDDWSRWRGADGSGVAGDAPPLPTKWQPGGSNIAWTTPIPGEGISSPVIGSGRIFLTTAVESRSIERWRTVCGIGALALGFLFLMLSWRGRRRGRESRVGWENRFVVALSILVAILAAVIAWSPEEFIDPGNPGRAYRLGGSVLLLAMAAASGWFSRSSPLRLIGGAAVLFGIALFLVFMPASSRGATPFSKSLPFVFLPALFGIWHLAAYWKDRKASAPAMSSGAPRPLLASILVLLGFLVYVPTNLLSGLDRMVICLDEQSGEILWEKVVLTSPTEKKWPLGTFARPTPVTDGELVFAYFGHGLVALDYDGEVVWRQEFTDYYGRSRYGASVSPILNGEALILGRDREWNQEDDVSWLAAWNKRTGEILWRQELPESRDSYSTPLLFAGAGGTQLLMPSWHHLASFDVDTGERYWRLEFPMHQVVASMVQLDDMAIVTGGTHGERRLIAYRLSGGGRQTGVEIVWQTDRSVAGISSPVVYEGKLFTVTVPGIMMVYDVETGDPLWKKRLKGEHYASLVAGDGKVYAVNTDGAVSVISAADLEVLAVNDLDDPIYASPAVSKSCLVIRTASSLYCIEAEKSAS